MCGSFQMFLLLVLQVVCVFGFPGYRPGDDDGYDGVFRVYKGQKWDSHDDFISMERSARDGDEDESQFRSWKLDQYQHIGVQRVKVELFDDGINVAEFEFEADPRNLTGFFKPQHLKRSSYRDIPTDGRPFPGDDFSFEGNGDDRHWAVSASHRGDCLQDAGWLQIIDKPKPHKNRCVCDYENIDYDDLPAIMYAKGNTKSKWSDSFDYDVADMMQISFSKKPFPRVAPPVAPKPVSPAPPMLGQPRWFFETKK